MQQLTLQPREQENDLPGPIPWTIAVLSLAGIAYLTTQQLQTIHNDVSSGVRAVMASSNVGNQVNLAIDGRDVAFDGTVAPDIDRDWFIRTVTDLPQVRISNDNMIEHDPVRQARVERQQFQQSLTAIDTSTISFEPNSSDFTAGSETALDKLALLLSRHPERRLKVAGHTDSSGRRDRNLELSRLRARAVTSYLMTRGIPDNQLISQGYGSTQPIDTNETEIGRANNRRIDLIVMN